MIELEQYGKIWEAILEDLSHKISSVAIDLWFGNAELFSISDTEAVINVPNSLKKGIIEKRYDGELKAAFEKILGFSLDIKYVSPDEEEEEKNSQNPHPFFVKDDEKKEEEPKEKEEKKSDAPFSPEYTFDNFIVGGSNKFAHAACIAVAKNPANDQNSSEDHAYGYNPLFIYGASGLGKTHLLNAIMNEMARRNPNVNMLYVKGEDFTNELIDSIAHKTQEQFRAKYRKADVLLMDDIQFIAGKDSTQEEFFHTFNALYEKNKQIIVTSDLPPGEIKTLEDRLKTRFEWGIIADIQPPDFELRIAIIRNKANMIGLTLSDEVCKYIAENLKSNIRQLEGSIKRICAMSFLNGDPVTIEMARLCIGAYITPSEPPTITAKKIVSKISKKYGITEADIYGRKRVKEIANARNISIYIIRQLTELTLVQIAQTFDRDHTTILSSIKAIETEKAKNPFFEMEISNLIKEINE